MRLAQRFNGFLTWLTLRGDRLGLWLQGRLVAGRGGAVRGALWLRENAPRLRYLFRLRGWIILALSLSLFGAVFLWSRHVTRVSEPPPSPGAPIDIVVPLSYRGYAGDFARLGVEVGVHGCHNPVTVVVSIGAAEAGRQRNWLLRPARIAIGVADASAHNFRLFVGDASAASDQLSDPRFRGSQQLTQFASGTGRGIRQDLGGRGRDRSPVPNLRGLLGTAPARAIGRGLAPEVVAVFEVNWISSRSFATCYLRLPQVAPPGPNPLLPLPAPRSISDTLGYTQASIVIDAKRFDGRGVGPLQVIQGDSFPRPADPVRPLFACTGEENACSGGYLALATPNADGKTSGRLLLLSAMLGVLAAIFAEQLIRFKWPLP